MSAPPTSQVLTECVRSATAAPSLHNSQPWRFRFREAAVDVYADSQRRLHVLDPAGREQLISVGAAVFTLRLALRQAGFWSDVTLFPEPDEPDLVARVTPTTPARATSTVEALASAIPHRHTNRHPFAQAAVPAAVVEELRGAAYKEGAVLAATAPTGRDAILRMGRFADGWLQSRPGYHDELARWTRDRVRRQDGIPQSAAGPWDALEVLPTRDFSGLWPGLRRCEKFEPHPTILVLATAGDQRSDWVRAGQALQRVLLTATWKGLATTPISQPVEMPAVRCRLIDPQAALWVQMVLRIGYGTPAGRTPRRPLKDVLLST
ncbi:Acg family FMN-binding oxidoreductase [Actinoplanes sp. NPDC049316]|uniref:Acg family FMN-binding oxidoreductase n=1 Tax=Actinoplanes sp. NPDC049316 TaxID=3154727 RepID=UPI003443C207